MKSAVVLVSGGLDSATTLAIAKADGYTPYCLTFRYGQRNHAEVNASLQVVNHIGGVKEHKIADIDLRVFGGSALTDQIDVPKNVNVNDHAIPVTYVPARNLIFLSYALGYAESRGISEIFIGVNAVDYSHYPDCRPAFIRSFENTANLATKIGVAGKHFHIHTPLMKMKKSEIIKRGLGLGVDYAKTLSCYDPDKEGRACGKCACCLLRLRGFQELSLNDPAAYNIAN